jgi:hypothetical protein
MTDLVVEAAAVMQPLLAFGAGSVATGAAEKVGADLLTAMRSVLARIFVRGEQQEEMDADELIEALRIGLDEGVVAADDLRRIVDLGAQVPAVQSTVVNKVSRGKAKHIIQGGNVNITISRPTGEQS